MTKEEILKLIDQKIENSQITQEVFEADEYYYGFREGLRAAKALIGMLDKPNNHL